MTEKALGHLDRVRRLLARTPRPYGQHRLADVYAQLADVYGQQGAYPRAIRADRQALHLDSTRTAVRFHLATLYDDYYADSATAQRQYQLFLDASGADEAPAMRTYARRRLRTLRRRSFFEAAPDTATR